MIGVTGPTAGGYPAWFFTRLAVWRAGGRARRITPRRPCAADELDGLIIGGGADVDPQLYGEDLRRELAASDESRRPKPFITRLLRRLFFPLLLLARALFSTKRSRLDGKDRDALETTLLKDADGPGLPVLGICRGMQLLNVQRGGSLHQDLASFYTETPAVRSVRPVKDPFVEADSRLTELATVGDRAGPEPPKPEDSRAPGALRLRVNALHRQAVHRLGAELRVVARDAAGVVYAIEAAPPSERFVLGVQWHPEYLPFEDEQLALFRGLVNAARARSQG